MISRIALYLTVAALSTLLGCMEARPQPETHMSGYESIVGGDGARVVFQREVYSSGMPNLIENRFAALDIVTLTTTTLPFSDVQATDGHLLAYTDYSPVVSMLRDPTRLTIRDSDIQKDLLTFPISFDSHPYPWVLAIATPYVLLPQDPTDPSDPLHVSGPVLLDFNTGQKQPIAGDWIGKPGLSAEYLARVVSRNQLKVLNLTTGVDTSIPAQNIAPVDPAPTPFFPYGPYLRGSRVVWLEAASESTLRAKTYDLATGMTRVVDEWVSQLGHAEYRDFVGVAATGILLEDQYGGWPGEWHTRYELITFEGTRSVIFDNRMAELAERYKHPVAAGPYVAYRLLESWVLYDTRDGSYRTFNPF